MLFGVLLSAVLVVPVVGANLLWPSARTFWRSMRVWSGAMFAAMGVRVAADGAAPEGPVVYVANHSAMVDIPTLLLGIPGPFVFVARKEIGRIPIVGAVVRRSRCVLLDRSNAGPALEEAAARVSEGDPVLMFPEGTRRFEAGIDRFRTGAFRLAAAAGVPVVPVAVRGATDVLSERRMTGRPGTVRVRVGAPLPMHDGEAPAAWAERTRAAVLDLLAAMDAEAATKKPAPPEERRPVDAEAAGR